MQKRSSIQSTSEKLQQSRSLEENKQAPFFTPVVQPKLNINQPNDIYEQEADATADNVMRMPDTSTHDNLFFKPVIQRKCASCDEEGKQMQRKETSNDAPVASTQTENYIHSLGGKGRSLTRDEKDFFETRMEQDFNDVKIHNDNDAARSAQSINALAYTSGNNIVFNKGQFNPQSEPGKKLLAHELTHVVQQSNGIQMQSAGAASNERIQFTEEIIELKDDSIPSLEDITAITTVATGNDNINPIEEPVTFIQKRSFPSFIQKADDAPAPVRKDYVFLMGSTGGFYVAAKKFFQQHHPEAEIISLKDNSLAGIFAKLRDIASDQNPIGNLYIVSHANVDGTLSFGLAKKDKDKKTTFGELKNALVTKPELFNLSGGIDDKTKVHIKGCNIGRNEDMLNALDEAFGGKTEVDAPTHKQGYEYHTKKEGKKVEVVSTEFLNTYNVEFSGNVNKSDDELVDGFKEKYTDFGFSDQDWEIAVLGAKKQSKKVDTAAAANKKEVDTRLKESLAELDKKAPDYKDEVKRLKAEAETEKAGIATAAKEQKKTDVAKGSKGVSRKVILPFAANLFDDKLPPQTEAELLKKAPLWFAKERKKGWVFTSGKVTKTRDGENDKFNYDIGADNKGEVGAFSYEISMPAFPETDEDAIALAEAQLEKYLTEHPEFAISRRAMFEWRVDRKKVKEKDVIKAFLEMTIYTIDLDLRESGGAKIDPASREGEGFFYGQSDFE